MLLLFILIKVMEIWKIMITMFVFLSLCHHRLKCFVKRLTVGHFSEELHVTCCTLQPNKLRSIQQSTTNIKPNKRHIQTKKHVLYVLVRVESQINMKHFKITFLISARSCNVNLLTRTQERSFKINGRRNDTGPAEVLSAVCPQYVRSMSQTVRTGSVHTLMSAPRFSFSDLILTW